MVRSLLSDLPSTGGTKTHFLPSVPKNGVRSIESRTRSTLDQINAHYLPETQALLRRMVVQPNEQRKSLINSVFVDLVQTPLWQNLEFFFMFAAHDYRAALLDWRGKTAGVLPNGVPAIGAVNFTTDQGFFNFPTGSGDYIGTNPAVNIQGSMVSMGYVVSSPDSGALLAGFSNQWVFTTSGRIRNDSSTLLNVGSTKFLGASTNATDGVASTVAADFTADNVPSLAGTGISATPLRILGSNSFSTGIADMTGSTVGFVAVGFNPQSPGQNLYTSSDMHAFERAVTRYMVALGN